MKTLIAILLAALLACGCASRPEQPAQIYDFGVAAQAASSSGSVFVAEVRTANWLATTDMFYRLAYRDPRELAPYANSRWAGTPAAMLTVRLRESIGDGSATRGSQAECVLALSVSEFSQVFSAENESRAVLHAQATLLQKAGGRNLSRNFRVEEPATTSDAAGGAAAFSNVADTLSSQLKAWIAETGACEIR
jgi:cholesterol transport system auxiliary component